MYFVGCDIYLNFDKYLQTFFKHVVLKYSCNKVKELQIIKIKVNNIFKFNIPSPT
jgi:hypothetical protein